MADLTLYAEASWTSPWVMHVMVALEEKQLPYQLEVLPLPIPEATKAQLAPRTRIAKVPILVHGELWLTESLAISEYLAETFPFPGHPRLFPAAFPDRARARQIMMFLRTATFALREARSTSSVFGKPVATPMSEAARADAAQLEQLALAAIPDGQTTLFGEWCIADCDLGLALMRLVANGDPVAPRIAEYARAQFARPSVRTFLAHAAK